MLLWSSSNVSPLLSWYSLAIACRNNDLAGLLRAHSILLLNKYLIHISGKGLIKHLRGGLLTLRGPRVLRGWPDLLRHECITWRRNGLIHTLDIHPCSLLHLPFHSLTTKKEGDRVRVLHLEYLPLFWAHILHAVSNGLDSFSGRNLS